MDNQAGYKAFEKIKAFCSDSVLYSATRSGRFYGTQAAGAIMMKQGKIKGRTIHYGRWHKEQSKYR